jgi:hypothetical protein
MQKPSMYEIELHFIAPETFPLKPIDPSATSTTPTLEATRGAFVAPARKARQPTRTFRELRAHPQAFRPTQR